MSTQIATITPRQLHDAQLKGRYSPVLDVRTAAESWAPGNLVYHWSSRAARRADG